MGYDQVIPANKPAMCSKLSFLMSMNKPFLTEVREFMRQQHYSIHTERAYCDWIKRFIHFHQLQQRTDLLVNSHQKVEAFLTHLAVQQQVAASTQNQAFNALLFLFNRVLEHPLQGIEAVRANRTLHIPVVLSRDEVKFVLVHLRGMPKLVVQLLYGSGLRISEAIRLRVQDVDFSYRQITVRNGKGLKDRVTPFAGHLQEAIKHHLVQVKETHQNDLDKGFGQVYLPFALARKYPNAASDWGWQYVFPSRSLAVDPRSGITRRHHVDSSVINKAIKVAVKQ
jgi:integron integrase